MFASDGVGEPKEIGAVPFGPDRVPVDLLDHLSPRFIACSILPWADALLRSTPDAQGRRTGDWFGHRRYAGISGPLRHARWASTGTERRRIPGSTQDIAVHHGGCCPEPAGPRFPLERDPGSADSLLRWYLESYGTQTKSPDVSDPAVTFRDPVPQHACRPDLRRRGTGCVASVIQCRPWGR